MTKLHWLADNWYWIAGVLIPILLHILNAATKRFSEYPKTVSWLMLLVDLLSSARARGTPEGAILGSAKIPLFQLSGKPSAGPEVEFEPPASAPPAPPAEEGFASIWVLALLDLLLCLLLIAGAVCLTSCANSLLGKLGQLQTSVQGLRQSSTAVLDSRCADLVPKCPGGGLALCTSYQQCAAARRIIYASAGSLQITIDTAASLAALEKNDQAKALLPTIGEGLNRLVQQLIFYDVLRPSGSKPTAGAVIMPTAPEAEPALPSASLPGGSR